MEKKKKKRARLLTLCLLVCSLVYLTAPGLSCGTRGLQLQHENSWLGHMRSSSLTRDQIRAPCMGSTVLATGPPGRPLDLALYTSRVHPWGPPAAFCSLQSGNFRVTFPQRRFSGTAGSLLRQGGSGAT